MTAAITPERVLRAIDRKYPWYRILKIENGTALYVGTNMTYEKFNKVMIDEKITFNERTIKYHWKKLIEYGFFEVFRDENDYFTKVRSVPDAIAKEIRIKMTIWIPAVDRMKSRWQYGEVKAESIQNSGAP
jgi:hypothetical protein